MRKISGLLMFVGMVGCADLGVTNPPLSTIPQQPAYAEECHSQYPCYESLDDVPPEIRPEIISIHPVVYWDGSRAVGSSRMHYFGNRAEESFTLTITGPSSATRTAEAASTAAIIPWYATHTTPGFTLAAPNGKSCGHHAQLTSVHHAISTAWLEFRGFGELRVMQPGGDDRPQPECACSGGSGPGDEPVLSTTPNFTPSATCSGDGGGGPGGDGGPTLRCYTVTIEHYYYHPDTGAVEYRYTEQYSYCEQVE
jgi:hypothetical protein